MGIFNEFNKKEKPIFTGSRFGFGAFSGGGGSASTAIEASGGTTTYIHNGYKVHCYYNYTPSPEKVFNVTAGTGNIEVFMIGGGGTGNYDSGGGGGGGAAVYGTGIPVDPSMNMAITVEAGAPAVDGYFPGSEPTSNYLNDHGGKPAIIAHPGGNIVAHGGNPGGTSYNSPYPASPITPGVNQSDGLYGSGGGAHKSGPDSTPIAAGALRTSYPTPSAGTFTVHRNTGGSCPANDGWQGAGGGGAGAAGGNTGAAAGIQRLFRVAREAGDGGIGYDAATNITWMTTAGGESGYFGAGGGGGGADPAPNGTGGQKGLGGGGAGDGQASNNENQTAGAADTGGGGGGGDGSNAGSNGGSGAVFIAYQHTATTPGPYGGTASGGYVSAGIPSGDYRYFVFTRDTPNANMNLALNQECSADNISILVVAGGGGGGSGHAGGGGAGGVNHLEFGMAPIPSGTHPVTVGNNGSGGPGPNAGGPNIATSGEDSTFGASPSKHYMVAKGGGGGGGWIDSSSNPAIGRGLNGGSGGGSTGTAPHSRGYNLVLPSTQRAAGRARHYGNPGGYGSYAGGGGGGAGSIGQTTNQGTPGIPSNPPNIPADHPNYPNGGGGGNGPFPGEAPYNGPTSKFLNAPFHTKVWPTAADHQEGPEVGYLGGFGGWGASFPQFPGPVIAPGIPSGSARTNFQNAVTTNGIFAGGGGGGAHTATGNPYTYLGGGAGGMGGGGAGGKHASSNAGQAAVNYTGSGGGGAGNQPEAGGNGAEGVVIVKIKMS